MSRPYDYVLDAAVLYQPGVFRRLVRAKREVVQWHPASQRPDSDLTVLINAPTLSEPVWLGFWDDAAGQWFDVSGNPLGDAVVEYAHLPKGRL